MKVSVFPVSIVCARSEVAMELSIFCFLNSHNVRLVKIKEGEQFKFFSCNAIDVYANKFSACNAFMILFSCSHEINEPPHDKINKMAFGENTVYQILMGLTVVLQNYILPANRMKLFRT